MASVASPEGIPRPKRPLSTASKEPHQDTPKYKAASPQKMEQDPTDFERAANEAKQVAEEFQEQDYYAGAEFQEKDYEVFQKMNPGKEVGYA